jgi:hypothetical protein
MGNRWIYLCSGAYFSGRNGQFSEQYEFWNDVFYDMIQVYDNAIRKYKNLTYYNFGEILDIIINSNSFENIISKIEVLFTCIKRLDYNLNMPMMLDQFIIEFNRG